MSFVQVKLIQIACVPPSALYEDEESSCSLLSLMNVAVGVCRAREVRGRSEVALLGNTLQVHDLF